jgi:hypothetical protein
VAFSPDGRRIVSGSNDSTLKVWDTVTGQNLLSLEGHTSNVLSVVFSPDGRRIVSGSHDETVKVWDAGNSRILFSLAADTDNVTSVAFSPEGRRVFARDDAGKVLAWDAATGQLLPDAPATIPPGRSVASHGNRRVVADGDYVRIEHILTPEEQHHHRLEEEPARRILQARASVEFHFSEATCAENTRQPFAAVFHLDRLLPLNPGERQSLLERRQKILATVLNRTPGEPWAVRALARPVLGDPGSLSSDLLRTARTALAAQQDAPSDTLYGAVLLRTGAAREARLVVRAAIKKRGPDAPPVAELLLALAHLQLNQPVVARKYLASAVAWMQRGSEPVRAASLLGLAPRGPLAALGSLAVTAPDPRLVPLDPWTAHALTALRAEVVQALPAKRE